MVGAKDTDAGSTARVTSEFSGVPTGQVYPKRFVPGDVVSGRLATVAVENGWAKADKKAKNAAPENKALEVAENKDPFPTGAAKPLSSEDLDPAKRPPTSKKRKAKRK